MENNYEPWRRSRNKVIAGVCGGIAEKFKIDPVVVRLIFVLLLIFGGGGLLAYIILWIVLPEAPWVMPGKTESFDKGVTDEPVMDNTEPVNPEKTQQASRTQLVLGLIMIGVGGLFLVAAFIPSFNVHDLWPLALIVFGLFLLKPAKFN